MVYLKLFALLVIIFMILTVVATFSNEEPKRKNRKSDRSMLRVSKTARIDVIQQLESSLGKHFDPKREQGRLEERVVGNDTYILGNTSQPIVLQNSDCYFEDYEKQYFIYQILNLLTQMYDYEAHIDNNKTDNNNTGVAFTHLDIPRPKCNVLSTTSTSSVHPILTPVTPSTITSGATSFQTISPTTTTDGYRGRNWNKEMLDKLEHMTVQQLDELFHKVKGEAQKGNIDVSISSLCCSI